MRPGLTTLVSYTASGSSPRALGQYGHLSPARYSFTVPGGCDQLSAVFTRPPRFRTDALEPGRILRGFRGGTACWEGVLDDPAPGEEGWAVTAHGMGGEAAAWRAVWTGTWGTGTPDQVVNNAIGRGLDWVNPGIGSPSGMWVGQAADSASLSVADVLNLVCTKGGLTWIVRTGPGGHYLSVVPLPTSVNRLLVSADPVGRSRSAGPTTLYLRYQSAADNAKTGDPAVYSLTSVTQAGLEAAGSRSEEFLDISSSGTRTAGSAQGVGSNVLDRFTRNAFTSPFTIRYGNLLTLGGVAVDPGVFYQPGAATVVRLLLADYAPAADDLPGSPEFLAGVYEWDDALMVGTLTPFERLTHDFSSLMSMIGETLPVRVQPVTRRRVGR